MGTNPDGNNTTYTVSESSENSNKIIPTSLGWIFGPATILETSLLPYLKTLQFMVEVEGFGYGAGCQYGIELQGKTLFYCIDDSGNRLSNAFQISDSQTTISPSYSTSIFHLMVQNFTIIYFGEFANNSTRLENSVKSKYLRHSSDNTPDVEESKLKFGSVNLPTIDEVKLVMNFEKMIISTAKFYRHAKSGPDIWNDLELYKENDDKNFNFMQGYAAYPAPVGNQPDVGGNNVRITYN